jgi:hypothetical protein
VHLACDEQNGDVFNVALVKFGVVKDGYLGERDHRR